MTGEGNRQMSARRRVVPEIITFPAEVDISNALGVATEVIVALRSGVMTDGHSGHGRYGALRYLLRPLPDRGYDVAAESGAELRVVATSPAVPGAMPARGIGPELHLYGRMSEALSNAPGPASHETQPTPARSAPSPLRATAPELLLLSSGALS
jgi:hypothetical protein